MKGLVLNLLNAKTRKLAFSAFRNQKQKGHPFRKLTDAKLEAFTKAITKKHPHLADKIGNDEGIRLMFIDSKIMNVIIDKATTKGVPILTVHDSVICREKDEPYVRTLMREATKQVVGVELNFDVNRQSVNKALNSKSFRDRDYSNRLFQQALEALPDRETNYHNYHWNRFQKHINNK